GWRPRLALGVLRSAASFAATDLLALHLARVARDEAGRSQRFAQRLVVFDERPSDAVANRARLAGDAPARNFHVDVEPAGELHGFERVAPGHAARLTTEEFIQRTRVHGDLPVAGLQMHAGRGGLAAAGAVVLVCCCWHE